MNRKKSLLGLLVVVLLSITVIVYFRFFHLEASADEEKEKKPIFATETVRNAIANYEVILEGKVNEYSTSLIKFGIQGLLENGEIELDSGTVFEKNQLLCRLDNVELFKDLSTRKTELAALLDQLLPQLELKFPTESDKWKTYSQEIHPVKLLPELPANFSPNERIFLIEKGFVQQHVKIAMLEKKMEGYFFLAPYNGFVLQAFLDKGDSVKPGIAIAQIAERKPLMAKIEIAKKDALQLENIKSIRYIDDNRKTVASGKVIRKSTKKSCTDVYCSIKGSADPILPGMPLLVLTELSTSQPCYSLPLTAINGDSVQIVINHTLKSKKVTLIAQTAERGFVVGLNNGDKVLIGQNN